jgi:Peptidase_C39 like family
MNRILTGVVSVWLVLSSATSSHAATSIVTLNAIQARPFGIVPQGTPYTVSFQYDEALPAVFISPTTSAWQGHLSSRISAGSNTFNFDTLQVVEDKFPPIPAGTPTVNIFGFNSADQSIFWHANLDPSDWSTVTFNKVPTIASLSTFVGSNFSFQSGSLNLASDSFTISVAAFASEPQNFKQGGTPYGTQWAYDKVLNSLSDELRNTGCFVTSTAIVLNTLGHNVDPRTLNKFLRTVTDRASDGVMKFSDIGGSASYGQADGRPGPKVNFGSVTLAGDRGAIVQEIADQIAAHGPVILRVPAANLGSKDFGENVHAIVAWKVDKGQIYIRDPGWNGSGQTLDDYLAFANARLIDKGHSDWQIKNSDGSVGGVDYQWFFKTVGTSQLTYADAISPYSKIMMKGGANSPVELVITDPQGRRLGYDPTSGVFYNEIRDSTYFREGLAANISDETGNANNGRYGPIEFSIGEFIQGIYTVQVFGIDNGAWSLNFGVLGYNFDFNPNAYRASGLAKRGSQDSFSFNAVLPPPTGVPEQASWVTMIVGFGVAGGRLRALRLRADKKGWLGRPIDMI